MIWEIPFPVPLLLTACALARSQLCGISPRIIGGGQGLSPTVPSFPPLGYHVWMGDLHHLPVIEHPEAHLYKLSGVSVRTHGKFLKFQMVIWSTSRYEFGIEDPLLILGLGIPTCIPFQAIL